MLSSLPCKWLWKRCRSPLIPGVVMRMTQGRAGRCVVQLRRHVLVLRNVRSGLRAAVTGVPHMLVVLSRVTQSLVMWCRVLLVQKIVEWHRELTLPFRWPRRAGLRMMLKNIPSSRLQSTCVGLKWTSMVLVRLAWFA